MARTIRLKRRRCGMRGTGSVVADICLYGHPWAAGYLAVTTDGRLFGDGQPLVGRALTETLWAACDELRRAGVGQGRRRPLVRVFEPSGYFQAVADLHTPPSWGDLQWGPAPLWELSIATLIRGAA
jgi:hypothetical protein